MLELWHLGKVEGLAAELKATARKDLNDFVRLVDVEILFQNIDLATAWLDEIPTDNGSPEELWVSFNAGVAALVNGEPEQMRKRLTATKVLLDKYMVQPTRVQWFDLIGVRLLVETLIGERSIALDLREQTLAMADASDDTIRASRVRVSCALALGFLGDADGAWAEVQPLIRAPAGLTEWELKLHRIYEYSFGESAGYQALMAEMEARE